MRCGCGERLKAAELRGARDGLAERLHFAERKLREAFKDLRAARRERSRESLSAARPLLTRWAGTP
jgi:hypothetical protein